MQIQQQRKWRASNLCAVAITLCLLATSALSALAEPIDDADITSAITTEMLIDEAVPANRIDVSTTKGIVTLKGTTDSLLAKERAEKIAEAIVGVRAVVNRISVQPALQRTDKELAEAVENAWFGDPAADAYELKATAEGGVLTISGSVDSYAEKRLSEAVAKGVKGVLEIKNEIQIETKLVRPDQEIKREIESRLENDVRVDDTLVKVAVSDGKVTLSGTVGSLQEKNRAGYNAWVTGVKSVENDDIEIHWWARDDMRRKKAYVSRTDEEIEQAVNDALLYDPRVVSFNPVVEVSNGTVTLSGVVDNLKAKRAAEQDAKNTLGVWRVKNQLKVRPEIPEDAQLEKRVVSALREDPYVEPFEVTVKARNGWIHLSGQVDTSFEKNQAEWVASGVKGTVGVVNNLDYIYNWFWKPDWEIRADIEDQIFWSVFVDGSDITISVDNGVATLSGSVDSWSERQDAEKNAYQGGAKDVRNNLEVDYRYYGPYGPAYYGSPYYRGQVYRHYPYYLN